jgi:DNA-binding response OmpR family regulator
MELETFSKTALVVEDEPMISALLSSILENEGFRVLQAAVPGEAEYIWVREGGKIDLLFADNQLPGGCGHDLAEAFSEMNPDLKVIFMSGMDEHSLPKRDVSGSVFLKKPFSGRGVHEALRRVWPAEHEALAT